MGCRSTIIVEGARGGERLAELAMLRIARLEACWSRFLPDSDMSRINRADGARSLVRPATVTLLQAMAEATAVTAGAYDPTVRRPDGRASALARRPWPSTPTSAPCRRGLGSPSILGGIGKGLAADIVVDQVIAAGAAAAAVVIGGDGRVSIDRRSPPVDDRDRRP